jgi:hypothetical protein
VLPRAAWRGSFEKMALAMAGKEPPQWGARPPAVVLSSEMQEALAFYEAKAPVAFPTPEPWPSPDGKLAFAVRALAPEDAPRDPAVANVRLADLDLDDRPEILVSDMRHGLILLGRPYEADSRLIPIAQVPHPVHAEVVDLDGDSRKDLIVADLGEFYPSDHSRGAVVWLRRQPQGGFQNFSFGGLPRVADVQAVDLEGGGKGLLAAAFGWFRSGHIDLLRLGPDPLRPAVEHTKVDARAGTLRIAPADLDKDGRQDFVALVSQQYETVVAFLNAGPGQPFRTETLYSAPHPNWGSSGMDVVDFDEDGDLDVLMTNGDMFDDRLLKPYHGIRWLENKGKYPFTEHTLALLPGVHRALARDLDGDGDLDVVACVFTAGSIGPDEARLPSLVWLEQTKKGRFERHTLEVGKLDHATLDAADWDGDGDVDLAVGNFSMGPALPGFVTLWENRTPRRPR